MNLDKITLTDITNAATVHSQKGHHLYISNRQTYGISLCLSGKITYIQNGKEFVSKSGYAVILPEGGSYKLRRDETGDFPLINFSCEDFLCDEITVIKIRNESQLKDNFEKIRKLYSLSGERTKMLSLLYDVFYLLSKSDVPSAILPAIKLIESDFSNPNLSNEILAAECKISEIYFRKLFKKHFRTSPRQYVIELRIQNAKRMLSEGALKISSISEACGFAGVYHFSRQFKSLTGKTPSEYRRDNQIF
jgi:AraC-like DNA-binding protein